MKPGSRERSFSTRWVATTRRTLEIDGALAAARDLGIKVILVGQPEKLEPELKRCGWRGDGDRGIELVEAAEVIGMGEPVMTSVRRKKKSSLRIGTRLVTDGKADGFVSAGNTGAAMATAKMVIGMLPGVDRPALAALIPTKSDKPTLLLDVGANSGVQSSSPGAVCYHGRRLFARSAGYRWSGRRLDEHR